MMLTISRFPFDAESIRITIAQHTQQGYAKPLTNTSTDAFVPLPTHNVDNSCPNNAVVGKPETTDKNAHVNASIRISVPVVSMLSFLRFHCYVEQTANAIIKMSNQETKLGKTLQKYEKKSIYKENLLSFCQKSKFQMK